jgi:PAS domain
MTMLATPQPAVRHNRPVPLAEPDRLRHLDHAPDTAAELQRAHSHADLAVLVLDSALDLRCATPAAERLFRIGNRDLGHGLAYLANPLTGIDLLAEANHALVTGQSFSRELVNRSGARYLCRAAISIIGIIGW